MSGLAFYLRCIAISVLGVLFAQPAQEAKSQPQDRRFQQQLERIQQDWKFLRGLDESGRSYSILRIRDRPGAEKTTVIVKSKAGYAVCDSSYPGNKELLIGRNPHYAFLITKKEPAAGWTLDRFHEGSDFATNKSLEPLEGPGMDYLYPLSTVFHMPGDEFLSKLKVKITALKSEESTRLRMHFSLELMPTSPDKRGRTVVGELLLDPSRSHCVLEASQGTSHPLPYRVKREVVEETGHLVVRKIVVTDPDGKDDILEFTKFNIDSPVPERECYLSHYGLPEPLDVTAPAKPRTWWPYIFGTCAGACLIGALYLWRRTASRPGVVVGHAAPVSSTPPIS